MTAQTSLGHVRPSAKWDAVAKRFRFKFDGGVHAVEHLVAPGPEFDAFVGEFREALRQQKAVA